MFGVHRKIAAWRDAGLISADQAATLTAFERTRQENRFSGGLFGLAMFAILAGFLMVIGANWASIGDAVKLVVHAGLNIGAACAIWRFSMQGRDLRREGAVLALAGLTLTFMALLGQIYHLDGGAGGLLALWLVVITPFMIVYGRTMITAVPWVLAFLGSVPIILDQYVSHFPDPWTMVFGLAAALLLPLALIADGFMRFFRAARPVLAWVFVRAGFITLTLSAVGGTFLWFSDAAGEVHRMPLGDRLWIWAVPIAGLAGLLAHHHIYRARVDDVGAYRATLAYCALCLVTVLLPLLIPVRSESFVAAGMFILFWLGAGWYGHVTGAMRLVSLSVILIGIRIYAIFLEAFAGLLNTGIGLILAGLGMLGMIWVLRRTSRFVRTLSQKHGDVK